LRIALPGKADRVDPALLDQVFLLSGGDDGPVLMLDVSREPRVMFVPKNVNGGLL